jgi:hypothetical protein
LALRGHCLGNRCSPDQTEDLVGHGGNVIYRVFIGYHPESGTVTVVESSSAATTYDTVPALLAEVFQQLSIT